MNTTKLQQMEEMARHEAEEKFENAVVKEFAQKRLGLFPKLHLSELHLGKELGRGQFGVVLDIQSIRLNLEHNNDDEDRTFLEQHCQRPSIVHPNLSESRYAVKTLRGISKQDQHQQRRTSTGHALIEEEDQDERTMQHHGDDENENYHRTLMTGLQDLAIEAHFLAAIEHPHIVKLRGLSQEFPGSSGFFIIMDKLCCTLKDKIQFEWNIRMLRIKKNQLHLLQQQKRSSSKKMIRMISGSSSSSKSSSSSSSAMIDEGSAKKKHGRSPSKALSKYLKKSNSSSGDTCTNEGNDYDSSVLQLQGDLDEYEAMYNEFFMERLTVMNDLSSAILYLHNRGIMHRDVKADNIGFDVRGDVKLFDFGASTIFDPFAQTKPYYNLTSRVGSLSHMAPEVYYGKPYDESVDIYSLAFVFWGILSSHTSAMLFKHMSRDEFCNKVIKGGLRPSSMENNKSKVVMTTELSPAKQQQVLLTNLIETMWDATPIKRPNAKHIQLLLQRHVSMTQVQVSKDNEVPITTANAVSGNTMTTDSSSISVDIHPQADDDAAHDGMTISSSRCKRRGSFTGVLQRRRSSITRSQKNHQHLMVLTERKSTFRQRRFISEAAQ